MESLVIKKETDIKPFNDVSHSDITKGILEIEEGFKGIQEVMLGDCFPLKHTFVPGMCIREITMPAGVFVTSKIHKQEAPYFILKGDVSVLTEQGIIRIKAGFHGVTTVGTKRLLYCHEETVWVAVFRTDSTDLKVIEEEVIAKSFDELYGVIEIENFVKELAL